MGLTAFVLILLAAWLLGRWARAGYFGEGTARTMNGLAWSRVRRGPLGSGTADAPDGDEAAPVPEGAPPSSPAPPVRGTPDGGDRSRAGRTPNAEELEAELERLRRNDPSFAESERVIAFWQRLRAERRKEWVVERARELMRDGRGEDAFHVAGEEFSVMDSAEEIRASVPETPEQAGLRRAREAGEFRRAHARGKRQLRSALVPFAASGYWVFEDVPTDEFGILDQLLVGPCGLQAFKVMPHPGFVSHGAGLSWWPPPEPGGRVQRRAFAEDPHEVVLSQVSEIAGKVGGKPWKEGDGYSLTWPPHFYTLCFTEAKSVAGEDGLGPPLTCDVWQLGEVLAAEEMLSEDGAVFDAAEQRQAVETIRAAYEREPWMVPDDEG